MSFQLGHTDYGFLSSHSLSCSPVFILFSLTSFNTDFIVCTTLSTEYLTVSAHSIAEYNDEGSSDERVDPVSDVLQLHLLKQVHM